MLLFNRLFVSAALYLVENPAYRKVHTGKSIIDRRMVINVTNIREISVDPKAMVSLEISARDYACPTIAVRRASVYSSFGRSETHSTIVMK